MEIIGKVQNDLSVRVMASTDFGPESSIGEFFFSFAPLRHIGARLRRFGLSVDRRRGWGYREMKNGLLTKGAGFADFNAVDAVVDVTHRYPEMFYPKEQ